MADIHQLVLTHGRDGARRLIESDRASVMDIAAAVLEEESRSQGFCYSGFCLTSLPHRKLADEERWERRQGRVTLVIEPGAVPKRGGGLTEVGVPYGSRARLLLIYMQTVAMQTGSREVELGRTMNAWLSRMDIPVGGTTYAAMQEQARRINHCRLTFFWDDGEREGFAKETIVDGGIRLRADDRQGALWQETVKLSDSFYQALTRHPVPVWEPAIRHLSGQSMALDVYVWLAYRLHILAQDTPVSWAALHAQFGGGYKAVRQFKPEFRRALDYAMAVYPDACVSVDEAGVVLRPSRPPIPEREVAKLAR